MTATKGVENTRNLYAILGVGVCAVSVAAPLIKATDAPAASIAAF